jgi:hypothetical protein
MRRAGHNPTDIQVLDILNSIDDESGYLDFQVSALTFAPERVLKVPKREIFDGVFLHKSSLTRL